MLIAVGCATNATLCIFQSFQPLLFSNVAGVTSFITVMVVDMTWLMLCNNCLGRHFAPDVASFVRDVAQTKVTVLGPDDFPLRVVENRDPWFVDFFAPVKRTLDYPLHTCRHNVN